MKGNVRATRQAASAARSPAPSASSRRPGPPGPFQILIAEHAALARRVEQVRRRVTGSDVAFDRSVRALHDSFEDHQRREDDVLYPLCERLYGGPEGPSSVMREEHAAIQHDLTALAGGRSLGARRAAVERLSRELEAHVSREERVLFPLTAALLSDSETFALARRLREPVA